MVDIDQLNADIAEIKAGMKDISEIKDSVKDIFKVINGNGSIGLVTQAQLNKQSLKRTWWWLGGISMAMLGVAGYIIRCGISP